MPLTVVELMWMGMAELKAEAFLDATLSMAGSPRCASVMPHATSCQPTICAGIRTYHAARSYTGLVNSTPPAQKVGRITFTVLREDSLFPGLTGRFNCLPLVFDACSRLDTPTDQSAAIAARPTTKVAAIVPSFFECHLKVVEACAMIFTLPRLARKNRLLPTELVETLRVTCTVWHRRHLDVGVYIILHLCACAPRVHS